MKSRDEIKICSNHDEFKVPLIWTFAFNGSEYWCPYCGFNGGMFGSGENVRSNKTLRARLEAYKKFSEDYLNARGSLVAHEVKYKGKWIKPSELPEEERNKYKTIIAAWKYKVKLKNRPVSSSIAG